MFEHKKLGLLAQKFNFAHFAFHEFPQNSPTCATHNLLNFHILKMILDFLKAQDGLYTFYFDHFCI